MDGFGVEQGWEFGGGATRSRKMREIFQIARAVAPLPDPVLILGERGVGKTWLAQALHRSSGRSGPLVDVDCDRMSPEAFERELFGPQAASGVSALERAVGGSLLLRRVNELRWDQQSKLLRFLDAGDPHRFGGPEDGVRGVRVLATGLDDLPSRVEAGSFRADLYFRLSAFWVRMPPLRARMEDLPLLVRQFLNGSATTEAFPSAAAWAALEAYPWPGNLRELGTVLLEAGQRSSGPGIDLSDLPAPVRSEATLPAEENHRLFFKDAKDKLLAQFERSYLSEVLRCCDGNLSHAARASGLHRRSVLRLAKKYQLQTRAPKGC